MQGLRNSLERNTRTMVASMAETARDATYKANSKLFSGYRYVGTLDDRTCLVCGELDGQVFETLDEAPELPAHDNCRCLYIPELKGMEGFDDDDERASMDGLVSANMTYEDWLKTQPDDVVRDILGPTRFNAYKNGMPITSFVSDGKAMTLEQLAEKEGLISVSADNQEDNTPAIKVQRQVSYSTYKDAIFNEGKELFTMGKSDDCEYSSAIIKNGVVLGTYKSGGDSRTVNAPAKDILNAMKAIGEKTFDFMHIHLDGKQFGIKDMYTMCKIKEMDRSYLALENGDVYYMSVGKGYRIYNIDTIKYPFQRLEDIFTREIRERDNVYDLSTKQEIEVRMMVVAKMKNVFGWDWEKYDGK